jgi:glycopeptide antibiotics resistance protein
MIGFTIDLHPPMFLALFILSLFISLLVSKFVKKKSLNLHYVLILSAFVFYLVSVFKLVILPISFFFKGHQIESHLNLYFQLIPFESIKKSLNYGVYKQVIGNVLLLFPLPVLWQLTKNKMINFQETFFLVFCSSLLIETTQLIINFITHVPNKVADIDDLILNTIGGIIGWLVFKLVYKISPIAKILEPRLLKS